MSGDTIGMMEGAFFVSKGVILDWVNELLDVSNIYQSTHLSLGIALTYQNRTVCHGCCLLPSHRRNLPRLLQPRQG